MRTAIFSVTDLEKARDWYTKVLGVAPYFDQPFYVGFNVGGFELGLDPDTSENKPGRGGVTTYWGVKSAETQLKRIITLGGKPLSPLRQVGEGIKVATVTDPFGNVFGLIENPGFKLARQHAVAFLKQQAQAPGNKLSENKALKVALASQRAARKQAPKKRGPPKRSRE